MARVQLAIDTLGKEAGNYLDHVYETTELGPQIKIGEHPSFLYIFHVLVGLHLVHVLFQFGSKLWHFYSVCQHASIFLCKKGLCVFHNFLHNIFVRRKVIDIGQLLL